MGNNQTKQTSTLDDWQKISNQNGIEIYKNKITNVQAEKRLISIDAQYDLNDEKKIYKMRQTNTDSLVKAYSLQQINKNKSSQGICSSVNRVSILTQRIPHRLSELPQLTFPQTLLILKQSLKGYSKIYKNYGPIHVTSNLIGINNEGQVKSWINQNWAMNHPNHDLPTLQSTKLEDLTKEEYLAYGAKYRDQTEMVHNIVAVVEEKCQEGKFPKAFAEEVTQHMNTFKKIDNYLDDFIHYNQMFIPPKINYQTVYVASNQKIIRQSNEVQQSKQKVNAVTNTQPVINNSNIQLDSSLYGYNNPNKMTYYSDKNKFNTTQQQLGYTSPSIGFTTSNPNTSTNINTQFNQNTTIPRPSINPIISTTNPTNTFSIKNNNNTTNNSSFVKPNISFQASSLLSNTNYNNNYNTQPLSFTDNNNNNKYSQIFTKYASSNHTPSSTLINNNTINITKQVRPSLNYTTNFNNSQYNPIINNNNNNNINNNNYKQFTSTEPKPFTSTYPKVDYSFDKIFQSSKFNPYEGSGYSNTLTKYQTINNNINTNRLNPEVIMKPTVSQNFQNKISSFDMNNNLTANNYERSLQNISKMVERASNQVAQSAIKQF